MGFDARSYVWDVASDVRTPTQAAAFAASLIPEGEGSSKFWTMAAQDLFIGCVRELQNTQSGTWGFPELAQLLRRPAAVMCEGMRHHYEHLVSACEAVLSGGLVTTDNTYDYILEVDLDMSTDPHPDHLVIHPEMVRHPADPEFKKDADGLYRFKCWIPHDAVGHLHRKQRTKGWTTDSWTTVNYYLSNAQGIGLGFKVLSVPKAKHAKVFSEEPVTAVVEEIKRRWVTLRLEK